MSNFYAKIYQIVKKIPRGKVSTYGLVAQAAGSPGAARAVGNAMRRNARPFYKSGKNKVPCHRVVKSDGTLDGFSGGLKKKVALLQNEGVVIRRKRIVDFKKVLFRPGS